MNMSNLFSLSSAFSYSDLLRWYSDLYILFRLVSVELTISIHHRSTPVPYGPSYQPHWDSHCQITHIYSPCPVILHKISSALLDIVIWATKKYSKRITSMKNARKHVSHCAANTPLFWHLYLKARFMGSTWGPPGADRTQVGPMWATWTLLSG